MDTQESLQPKEEQTHKSKDTFILSAVAHLFSVAVLIYSIPVFLVIPFLSLVIDHSLAQWLWYPALIGVFFAIPFLKNRISLASTSQATDSIRSKPNALFVIMLSCFLWIVFISGTVFINSYYLAFSLPFPILIGVVFLGLFLCMIPTLILLLKEKRISGIEVFDFYKNGLYGVIMLFLLGLVYFAYTTQKTSYIFLFGIPYIILQFWSLIREFLSPPATHPVSRSINTMFSLYLFLTGIALIIYMIYLIPDRFPNLQTIILTIVASVMTGTITLVGVAWTIRQGQKERAEDRKQLEEDRKQEEIRKAKPFFSYKTLFEEPRVSSGKKVCLPIDMPTCPNRMNAIIENSNHSIFQLLRIYIDGKWHALKGNTVILPASETIIHFQFNDLQNIVIETLDTLGNYYYYSFVPLITDLTTEQGSSLYTLCEIYEISVEELQKRNIPLEDTP